MFSWKRFSHLTNVRDHFGNSAATLRILDRALQSIGCDVHKVLHNDNRCEASSPIEHDPSLVIRRLTVEDVESYSADPEYRLPVSFVARAKSDRQFCMATFCHSKLVAYGWYAMGSIDGEQNAGVAMSYPADTACVFRGFTHPDLRGQHVHSAVRRRLVAALAEQGVKNLIALVSWTNWPSMRYCLRVGYRDLGHLVTIGPRHRRLWFGPRDASHIGIRFGSESPVETRTLVLNNS